MSSTPPKSPSIDTDYGKYKNAARAAPISGHFYSTKYSSPSDMAHFMTPDEFIKSRSSNLYTSSDDIVPVDEGHRETTSSPTASTASSPSMSSQASTFATPTSTVPVSASQRSETQRHSLEDIEEEEHTPVVW